MSRFFADRLEQHGDRWALVPPDGPPLTYAALAAQADALAAGLGPGRRLVLVQAANAVEPIAAVLGALRAGHAVILAAGGAAADELVQRFQPAAIFADGAWSQRPLAPCHALHPELAVLLATSGSSGLPKLVRLSRGNLQANAESIRSFLGIGADARAVTTLPVHYSYGLSVLTTHLDAGASVVLTDRSVVDPAFLDLVAAQGVTSLAGVPHTYDLLERSGVLERLPPSVQTLTQAGGRLAPDAVARIAALSAARGIRFHVMYGQTEATARMAHLAPDLAMAHPDAIGTAIPGGRLALVDAAGAEIARAGVEGELVYAGPNVMLGYAEGVTDLAAPAMAPVLHTGDLATRDAAGLYRITGRLSRFVKLAGLRIGLDAVEQLLAKAGHPAAVAGNDCHLVVCPRGTACAAPDIVALIRQHYRLGPEHVVMLEGQDCPRLPSGKVDYPTILKQGAAARAAQDDAARPDVAAAFRWALGRQHVGPRDTFVSLGGDSLSYIQVATALEEVLGHLPEGWESMSVKRLERMALPARRLPHIDTDVVLRALAIIGVITTHSGRPFLMGGAATLMLLVGYNLARFKAPLLVQGRVADVLGAFVLRILLPYYVILLGWSAWTGTWDPAALLLASNFVGRFGTAMEAFWFLECLLQCLLLVGGLFLLPPVRALARAAPWGFAMGLFGLAVALRLGVPLVWNADHLWGRVPHMQLVTLALGWAVFASRTGPQKLVVAACAIALMPLTYGLERSQAWWLLLAVPLLLWLPRVPVPATLRPVLIAVAAASFWIYLTHVLPVHLFLHVWHWNDWLAIQVASLGLGVGTWWLVGRAVALRRRGPASLAAQADPL
ncbi:AMP-binding protein [Zavarzinia sp. CC-PAN008]|uniref:AMP-binding protein n=1 Tax=Zavarzinia sp. CC-PAN008 TaxID=3243332 RepID=UPI003F744EA5